VQPRPPCRILFKASATLRRSRVLHTCFLRSNLRCCGVICSLCRVMNSFPFLLIAFDMVSIATHATVDLVLRWARHLGCARRCWNRSRNKLSRLAVAANAADARLLAALIASCRACKAAFARTSSSCAARASLARRSLSFSRSISPILCGGCSDTKTTFFETKRPCAGVHVPRSKFNRSY
jgi:hypothetical protein